MIISIQFLRFIAALLVVLTHTRREVDYLIPIGDFGVDVFFVISGFIMSFITERQCRSFVARRLLRIVPLYWLFTILLAMIAIVLPDLLKSTEFNPQHLLASLFFFPDWSQDNEFKPMLMLGWTLNYEMYFYALFFLAILVSHRYREYICSVLLIVTFVVLNFAMDISETSPLQFYANPIALEFIFGLMLAVAHRQWTFARENLPLRYALILILASALIFLFSSIDIPKSADGPAFRWIVWGGPALLLVAAVLGLESRFRAVRPDIRKVFLLLGELSYPMYLIHIYFIALLSRLLGLGSGSVVLLFISSMILTLIASYVVSRYYDMPLRRYVTYRLQLH